MVLINYLGGFMKQLKIKITFTELLLGTSSNNKEIHEEFIASKSADKEKAKEELEALHSDELVEKTMTIFPKEDGVPFMWDYQVKGFFKDACSMLKRVAKTRSKDMTAYKKIIDGLVFVTPRKIMIDTKGNALGNIQRPLRGQTAQGERIALANSETVPQGSSIILEITLLEDGLLKTVEEWLNYGKLRGMGQWRNSGMGRFEWEYVK